LNTDLRCSKCRGRLWELEWRWRIPAKSDDKAWRELEKKVAQEAREWLPRRHKIGEEKIAEIDQQIQRLERQKQSESRDRRLRELRHKRRVAAKGFTEPDGAANRGQPVRPDTTRRSAVAGPGR
jgi:hypothetical protein